ncbi:uncharacterized protein N7443_000204 [Penicillium atrosanguineum]|uniref:Uncharacterized protein n=1 Tax=Penicillium atrosanguineum TaxID=1132637 RepID=A0A9W9QB14_9EURO|nr:uncharacterized protein N7443_000204 [Penicillium atrosanguineum]KAJ5148200.1 hypothetical protein N7526_001552 [Penicillium atrosanguineum]KAJ5313320.1 hypothetical protein N7443_000204 [Penicillium atrosanguineum]KAJ5330416.1 hypothetical protein N7476_000199 [Penicillium atrosanguineum]
MSEDHVSSVRTLFASLHSEANRNRERLQKLIAALADTKRKKKALGLLPPILMMGAVAIALSLNVHIDEARTNLPKADVEQDDPTENTEDKDIEARKDSPQANVDFEQVFLGLVNINGLVLYPRVLLPKSAPEAKLQT